MVIRFNQKFRSLVGKNFAIGEIKPDNLCLLKFVGGVIIKQDCFFFKKFAPIQDLPVNVNKSEYEFDENRIRIDDLIDSKIINIEEFNYGLSFVKDLCDELLKKFGHGFEIILSYDYEHCFIRFFRIRENINNFFSEDLELYVYEAMLRITV